MKFIDEYRDPKLARALVAEIAGTVTRPWVLMEICGGQTHTLMRYGIDELLPPQLELVHGPGCPVCVTPLEIIDQAVAIAAMPGVTLVSYGDMLRVPGSASDLFRVKAEGGDVRIAYSPMDAVTIARQNPGSPGGVLRRRFRNHRARQRDGGLAGRNAKASPIFRFWCRTCWCRPPSACCSASPTTACRASSRRDTSAPSWGTPNTRNWPAISACLSWSAGSSPSICWKPS